MDFKPEIRVIGWDDAPFERGDDRVSLVGVVTRAGSGYVEAVLRTEAAVDGDDATAALAAAVEGCRIRSNLVAVLVQNLMVGGFNTVDVEALGERLGLPVLAVARGVPDLEAVRSALVDGAIPNGPAKWERIERVVPRMLHPRGRKLTVTPVGLVPGDALDLLELTTVRGLMPEPLRLAHLIAAGWVLGESRGQ